MEGRGGSDTEQEHKFGHDAGVPEFGRTGPLPLQKAGLPKAAAGRPPAAGGGGRQTPRGHSLSGH
jgi:hypothetical protein